MREPRSFHGRPKLFLLNSASPPERLLAERASRVRCSHQTALWFHAIGFQSGMLSKKCCVSTLPHGYCRSRHRRCSRHRRPRLHGALTPPPRAIAQTSRVSLVSVSAGRTPRTAGRACSPLHDTALGGAARPFLCSRASAGPCLTFSFTLIFSLIF